MRKYCNILIIASCLLTISTKAVAQNWISLDGAPQGEAYLVEVMEDSPAAYVARIRISGLYDLRVTNGRGAFHQLSLGLTGNLRYKGKPALPVISRLLAIPSGAEARVTIEEKEWQDIEMGTILPAQDFSGVEKSPLFAIDEKAYTSPFIPELAVESEFGEWRGVRREVVSLCPFRYYPAENRLTILEDFILRVQFDLPERERGTTMERQPVEDYLSVFDNSVYFSSEQVKANNAKSSSAYDYLIIVSTSLPVLEGEKMKEFRRWKALMGYKTKVVSTSTTGIGSDMRNYIAQERSDCGIKYVLLVGNESMIPTYSINSFYYNNKSIASDYYYGCTSSFWDAVVPVGRFSVSTSAEFLNMVNKTIRYESTMPASTQVMLMANKYNPADALSYQNCMEIIRTNNYADSPSFITAYGSSTAEGGNSTTNTMAVNMINEGFHIINYRGYGTTSYWGGNASDSNAGWNVAGENFSCTQLNSLSGNANAVFFSVSRKTGDITTSGNMLEAFTRSSKGAVAFLGSTTDDCRSANHYYNLYLYKKLFDDWQYHLGDISIGALFECWYDLNQPSVFKDNAYSYICGGDPSLELWTDSPATMGDVTLGTSGNAITVNTGINSGYDVSISSEDGELLDHFHSYSSSFTFTKPTGNFWLSVRKHNHIPHVIYYNTDAEYIQNVTFNHDAYYNSTPLSIGEGVTADVPDGDVIVKSGSKLVIRNGPGGVLLDGGFKCEKGGILDIE